ncbi:MAG: hypothetical protein QOF48_3400, partial [Verrucomicrobiota bacterium]
MPRSRARPRFFAVPLPRRVPEVHPASPPHPAAKSARLRHPRSPAGSSPAQRAAAAGAGGRRRDEDLEPAQAGANPVVPPANSPMAHCRTPPQEDHLRQPLPGPLQKNFPLPPPFDPTRAPQGDPRPFRPASFRRPARPASPAKPRPARPSHRKVHRRRALLRRIRGGRPQERGVRGRHDCRAGVDAARVRQDWNRKQELDGTSCFLPAQLAYPARGIANKTERPIGPGLVNLASHLLSPVRGDEALRCDRGRDGGLAPPLPPNRTGGSPASGFPVSGFVVLRLSASRHVL